MKKPNTKITSLFLCLLAIFACTTGYGEVIFQALDKNLKPLETASLSYDLSDFSMQDAINIALKQNRSIISSREDVRKANGQVKQARSIAGTKVSGNFLQTRLDDVATANLGGQTLELGKKDVQKAYLELSQPLFLGTRDQAAIKTARLGRSISNSAFIFTQQQTIANTILLYLGWVYAKEVERVSEKDLELAQAHFSLVEKRYNNKLASKYELLRAEVRLTQTKSKLAQDKNNTLLNCSELLTLLGLPINQQLETNYRLEIEKIDLTNEIGSEAFQLKEDLKVKKLQAEIAKQSVKSARGEKHPTVNLFGQFGSENPSSKSGFGQLERKSYWNAGVAINFKLIDAGNTRGKIMESKAALNKAKNEYEQAIEQTKLEIHQAILNLKTAQEIVSSQKENLKQAEETMRLAKVRYENGMFTQVEMFDAENAYLNANLAYLQAVFMHHQARISYLLSTGKLGREFNLGI